MTEQEILNNAPEGAEYIDGEGVYWRLHDKYTWAVENPRTGEFVKQIVAYPSNGSVRSLADIRRIVELEQQKSALIEDRARFPDKPDFVEGMIGNHIKNKVNIIKSAEKANSMLWDKVRRKEGRIKELEQIAKAAISELDDANHSARCYCGHPHCKTCKEYYHVNRVIVALNQRLKGGGYEPSRRTKSENTKALFAG